MIVESPDTILLSLFIVTLRHQLVVGIVDLARSSFDAMDPRLKAVDAVLRDLPDKAVALSFDHLS